MAVSALKAFNNSSPVGLDQMHEIKITGLVESY